MLALFCNAIYYRSAYSTSILRVKLDGRLGWKVAGCGLRKAEAIKHSSKLPR
jgi:hypothetical protein